MWKSEHHQIAAKIDPRNTGQRKRPRFGGCIAGVTRLCSDGVLGISVLLLRHRALAGTRSRDTVVLRIQYRDRRPVRSTLTALVKRGESNRGWYKESSKSIARYARALSLDLKYVCDVLAILSPRVTVLRNALLAQEYIETGYLARGVMMSRRKALERYEATGLFGGQKVNAFANALRDGGGDSCVIDAWMFRAFELQSSIRNYRLAENRVRRAAVRFGWEVAETQSAIWAGVRDVCGIANNKSIVMDIYVREEARKSPKQ